MLKYTLIFTMRSNLIEAVLIHTNFASEFISQKN